MRTFNASFLFCGMGGGALGFTRARNVFRGVTGRFRICGAVDVDAASCRDFETLTGFEPTRADIHSMTVDDMREAHDARPDVVFLSPPCKGFSGLLSSKKAGSEHYQALNRLALEGLWLVLEAWPDDPPPLILIENVPRIATRGRELLDKIQALLGNAGYVFAESFHDCGELGGLGQRRRRFLMVARRPDVASCFLYEPPRRELLSIGDVLSQLPMPDDPAGGPMHRLSRLQWKTWVRLALIPAGGDWRDLPGLEGKPDYRNYGVVPWDSPADTVTTARAPGQGKFSVADPRPTKRLHNAAYRVAAFDDVSSTVTAQGRPCGGVNAVADPRLPDSAQRHHAKYRVEDYDEPAHTITGSDRVGSGAPSVADPRGRRFNHVYRVVRWDEPSVAVTGATGNARGCVADPRLGSSPRNGTLGVVPWDAPSTTVTASSDVHAGTSAVADPRIPAETDRPDPPPIIIALDGTWHRPLTTLELAALQSLPVFDDVGAPMVFDGKSHAGWRERIGNLVPPDSAEAIAEQMLLTLLASEEEAWMLSPTDIWVRREVTA